MSAENKTAFGRFKDEIETCKEGMNIFNPLWGVLPKLKTLVLTNDEGVNALSCTMPNGKKYNLFNENPETKEIYELQEMDAALRSCSKNGIISLVAIYEGYLHELLTEKFEKLLGKEEMFAKINSMFAFVLEQKEELKVSAGDLEPLLTQLEQVTQEAHEPVPEKTPNKRKLVIERILDITTRHQSNTTALNTMKEFHLKKCLYSVRNTCGLWDAAMKKTTFLFHVELY